MTAMWVIRAYNTNDDEFVAEHDLSDATEKRLALLLPSAPTRYGSISLEGKCLERVAQAFNLPIAKDAEYFLDFDAEPLGTRP